MQQFEAGKTVTLYVNFLTIDNKEATTIVDPKITIRHVDSSNTVVTDINEAILTLGVETMYFYKWTIPSGADLGEYTVEYEAVVDGEYAEDNETVQVVSAVADGSCTEVYTTAANVAEYLGVDESSISSVWLDWASRYIDTYTCQKFCNLTVTEKYDIEKGGQDYLFLDHEPLLEVIELKDDGTVVDSTDYLVYKDEAMIQFADDYILNILQVGAFTKGRQKVEVTYKYGYTAVPKEIEWAATVLTAAIGIASLTQSGSITVGDVVEEEIGEYRVKRSESSSSTSFSSIVEESQVVGDKLENDVFSVKNVLKIYRCKKMRAV